MTKEEKIFLIKEAILSGVPKRRIDIAGCGYSAARLQEGKGNSERKIDEMYENLLLFRNNAIREVKVADPELQRKINELRQAAIAGVPTKKIDILGGGCGIRRLLAGGHSKPSKIEEMYANLLQLRSNGGSHNHVAAPGKEELEQKVKAQELEIAALKSRLESLERTIQQNQALNKDEKKKQAKKVLGVPVTQKTDMVGGRKYVRWYGYTQLNGKRRWIYIGKDLSLASAKIKAFLEKEA